MIDNHFTLSASYTSQVIDLCLLFLTPQTWILISKIKLGLNSGPNTQIPDIQTFQLQVHGLVSSK